MEKQKCSFLNAHAFSNEKGAFGSFLLLFLPGFFGAVCLNDIIRKRFTWNSIVFFLVVSAVCSVLYFVAKFFAYRTKLFPKFKRRESLHMLSFFLLVLLTVIIYFLIMII